MDYTQPSATDSSPEVSSLNIGFLYKRIEVFRKIYKQNIIFLWSKAIFNIIYATFFTHMMA